MVVLDSWALLAYLKNESSADQIEATWLDEGAAISSINLGEVLYIRIRDKDEAAALADIEEVRRRLDVIEPDWALVAGAAKIKAEGGLSYADAFCIATAAQLDAPLWTGDPKIVERAGEQSCPVVDLRDQAS